jgi:hypothetical protein
MVMNGFSRMVERMVSIASKSVLQVEERAREKFIFSPFLPAQQQ